MGSENYDGFGFPIIKTNGVRSYDFDTIGAGLGLTPERIQEIVNQKWTAGIDDSAYQMNKGTEHSVDPSLSYTSNVNLHGGEEQLLSGLSQLIPQRSYNIGEDPYMIKNIMHMGKTGMGSNVGLSDKQLENWDRQNYEASAPSGRDYVDYDTQREMDARGVSGRDWAESGDYTDTVLDRNTDWYQGTLDRNALEKYQRRYLQAGTSEENTGFGTQYGLPITKGLMSAIIGLTTGGIGSSLMAPATMGAASGGAGLAAAEAGLTGAGLSAPMAGAVSSGIGAGMNTAMDAMTTPGYDINDLLGSDIPGALTKIGSTVAGSYIPGIGGDLASSVISGAGEEGIRALKTGEFDPINAGLSTAANFIPGQLDSAIGDSLNIGDFDTGDFAKDVSKTGIKLGQDVYNDKSDLTSIAQRIGGLVGSQAENVANLIPEGDSNNWFTRTGAKIGDWWVDNMPNFETSSLRDLADYMPGGSKQYKQMTDSLGDIGDIHSRIDSDGVMHLTNRPEQYEKTTVPIPVKDIISGVGDIYDAISNGMSSPLSGMGSGINFDAIGPVASEDQFSNEDPTSFYTGNTFNDEDKSALGTVGSAGLLALLGSNQQMRAGGSSGSSFANIFDTTAGYEDPLSELQIRGALPGGGGIR